MKLRKSVKKFSRVLKEYGFIIAIQRVLHFARNVEGRSGRQQDIKHARETKGDVLFINGYCLEHPTRYRVAHQMEQMHQAGIVCAKVYFEDLEQDMEENYGFFIIYRCECTMEMERFIERVKSHGKKVCFDVDDLVIDPSYTEEVPFVQRFSLDEKRIFDSITRATGRTLALCDLATTTTEALAAELEKVVPITYINRNTASVDMVKYSEQAYWKLQAEIAERVGEKVNMIRLGYFSGSLTHNHDFEIVCPTLMRLMEQYEQIGLILVGELEESNELKKFSNRIEKKPLCSWKELPYLISQADINLAPLDDTLFNRCKSENKWIEAALVRVPTVASKVGAFETMIENGITGILCENTDEDWYQGLNNLIDNEIERKKIAEKAYEYVMNYCTTSSKARDYADFIRTIQ